jgi:hypothetical protein
MCSIMGVCGRVESLGLRRPKSIIFIKSTPNHDHAQDDPTNKKQPISGKPTSKQPLSENNQLRLFFPRLGKVEHWYYHRHSCICQSPAI